MIDVNGALLLLAAGGGFAGHGKNDGYSGWTVLIGLGVMTAILVVLLGVATTARFRPETIRRFGSLFHRGRSQRPANGGEVHAGSASAPGAGWFSDPAHRFRSRYWDGTKWTQWVADDTKVKVDDHRSTDARAAEQSFTGPVLLIILPIWLIPMGVLSVLLLASGLSVLSVTLPPLWLLVLARWLRSPYKATVRADGTVTFKALTRTVATTTQAIYRVKRGGRGTTIFYFTDRSVSVAWPLGQQLSAYLQSVDPVLA
jgi:hypothetical protein